MSNEHIVVKGDTLSKISKIYSVPISELKNINHLSHPNRLEIGQHIALKKENVLGLQALILDKDRNPVKGMAYQFEFSDRILKGVTGLDGLTQKIMTISPKDEVRILVERMDKSLKQIAAVTSGYGNKLVTLVSPSIKVEAKTELHPGTEHGKLPNKKEKGRPIYDPNTKQPATKEKKELGPKVTPTKTPDGKPLAKVEGDIPGLDFLDGYTGEKITDADYEAAAKELDCEVEVIKAIEKVESGGTTGFDNKNRPLILFERHIFSRNSARKYDATNPDISSKTGYKLKRKEDAVTADALAKDYYAVNSTSNYKRLAKAYQLDKDAALKACSWGKFQVLGENYKAVGFGSVREMVDAHVKGPKGHLKTFIGFIKSKKLQKPMKDKNWEKIAQGYNGTGYKKFNYDKRIKKEYEKLKK
ncbi:MAG TPA: N-acetylmuramidase domain-containing protein [Burkholderiaceae bacterium]|jgi:murein DD-endopeptidase MepM/ murein hydrolase activator NlpD